MALQGWENRFALNVPAMDADHQKLVSMISSLYDSMKKGESKQVVSRLVTELNNYASTHFENEEKMLANSNSPEVLLQKEQHVKFLNKIGEFKASVDSGKLNTSVEMLTFLNNWFLNHIMMVDIKYKK